MDPPVQTLKTVARRHIDNSGRGRQIQHDRRCTGD